jgi:PIN domain nuclease of toxin-antitoxin system
LTDDSKRPAEVFLDSCAFLWAAIEPEKLSRLARSLISDARIRSMVSVATLWKLCLKRNKGKLSISDEQLRKGLDDLKAVAVPIVIADVFQMNRLAFPPSHKDPFDKIIVAQAIRHKIPFISCDRNLRTCRGLQILW